MGAANTDLFVKVSRRWVGQIGAGGVSDAVVTTIPLSSSTNLPTDTGVIAVIDRVDVNGTTTPNLEETIIGVVSGNNLVTCTRGAEGTAQAHNAGAVVEILFTAKGHNNLIDGILTQHNQDGSHKAITGSSVSVNGAISGSTVTASSVTSTNAMAASTISASQITANRSVTASSIGSPVATIPLDITGGFYNVAQAYTPSASATATLDLALSNDHEVTMPAGPATLAISHPTIGQKFLVTIVNVTSQGVLTWFSTIKWAGGSAPTLTGTNTKRDVFGFKATASSTFDGFIVGQNL